MTTGAIVLLRDDHKEIRRLFREFAGAGHDADATKGRVVDRIIQALTVHTYLENECVYPEVRELVPELADDILGSEIDWAASNFRRSARGYWS